MRNWIIAGLVVALLTTVGWAYWERSDKIRFINALEAEYQREFYNVVEQVDQIEAVLAKSIVSGSPKHNILYLTEVWNRSSDAQASLAELPFKNINLSASRKFLNQLGDYAYTLAEEAANTGKLEGKDTAKLAEMRKEVRQLRNDLHRIEEHLAGRYRWTTNFDRKRIPVRRAQTVVNPSSGSDLDGFVDIDKRMQELPSLVYDGPFSDHLQKRQPLGVTGNMVSLEQAKTIAKKMADGENGDLFVVNSENVSGKIPAYSITLKDRNQPGTINMDISKRGGHVIWLLNTRPVPTRKLDGEQAMVKAQRFLDNHGYRDMVPTYTQRAGNVQVISFAYQEDDIIIYPDLIKVKVASDNGQVVGLEALGYLMAHHERKLPKPKLSKEEALAKINSGLETEKARLALIPLDSGREVLTWEIKVKSGEELFLIYINALTGAEEQILQIIDVPGGQMAM